MRESDRPRFAELLSALGAAFGRDADEAVLEGYWLGLQDMELADFEQAVARAIRESEYMPKPVEIRRLGGQMQPGHRAVLAFEAVEKATRQLGSYASVDFDDPLINATVRNMGGWQELCHKETEEFRKWTRKDFERIYRALLESGVTEEQAKYLPGFSEQQNSANGYGVEPPVAVRSGLPAHRGDVVRRIGSAEGRLRLIAGKGDAS